MTFNSFPDSRSGLPRRGSGTSSSLSIPFRIPGFQDDRYRRLRHPPADTFQFLSGFQSPLRAFWLRQPYVFFQFLSGFQLPRYNDTATNVRYSFNSFPDSSEGLCRRSSGGPWRLSIPFRIPVRKREVIDLPHYTFNSFPDSRRHESEGGGDRV